MPETAFFKNCYKRATNRSPAHKINGCIHSDNRNNIACRLGRYYFSSTSYIVYTTFLFTKNKYNIYD